MSNFSNGKKLKIALVIFLLPGFLLATYVINFKLQHFDICYVVYCLQLEFYLLTDLLVWC
jgi:hypothetical protein